MKKIVSYFRRKYLQLLGTLPKLFVHPDANTFLQSTDWISDLSRLYSGIIKIIPSYSVRYYLEPYIASINALVEQDSEKYQRILALWTDKFRKADDGDRFFMTMLFLESGFLTDEVSEMLLKYALNTDSLLRSYCVAMEISIKLFHWGKGIYPGFYLDRKQVLNRIAAESFSTPVKQAGVDKEKKLCIVVYMLAPDLYNSVQRVAKMIENHLSDYYDEILVVSLETFCLSRKEEKKTFYSYKTKYSKKYIKQIKQFFSDKTEVFIPQNRLFTMKNQEVIDRIYAFHPDSIIDISDEMSSASMIYANDFPVYYIPMRSNASSSNFSYILGRKWKYEEGNKKYHSIDTDKIKEWMFPEYVPERTKDYTKAEIGVAEDSFVILSIGNNDKTYSEKFEDMLCQKIEQDKELVWFLVGNGVSCYVRSKYKHLIESKRIIEWGYEKNLIGICAACDIHLRPNMTGGSGATAIACMNGLPVVMTDFVCDPMRWMGRDFSALHSDEDMIAEITKLQTDTSYYQQQSKRALERVNKATDSDYWWSRLYELMNEERNREI